MLITPLDLLVVVAGLVVIGLALRRQWVVPPPASAPPALRGEVVLTVLPWCRRPSAPTSS